MIANIPLASFAQPEAYQPVASTPIGSSPVYLEATRTVLFTHQPLAKMSRDDRVRACYLHACLPTVNRDYLSNGSLRERFGIDARNSATASRLIGETMQAGMIRPYDELAAKNR